MLLVLFEDAGGVKVARPPGAPRCPIYDVNTAKLELSCSSQGLEVHPLSERPPPGSRTRTRSGALTRSEEDALARGFVGLQLLQQGLGLTWRVHVQDPQRGVPPARSSASSGVVPLELLDDGGKLGVQGGSARFGARRRPGSAVLLLLVRRRRRATRGRGRRPAGTSGRSVRLAARRRGRGSALLAAAGGRGADGARVRGGGFARRQNALLHRQRVRAVKQSRPVGHFLFLLAANEEAAVRFLYFGVDDVRDALKPAG